jgi:cytoskeletal protein RodZ
MSTVAEQLRSAREAKSLTVEQVAEMTKIRTDHIRALEEGNFNVFSAPIYIRSSVKIYAKMVKLDEAPLLAALDAELKGTAKYSEPPPLVETQKTFVDTLILLLAKLNWKVSLAAIAIVLLTLMAVVSIWAWHHHQKNSTVKLAPGIYQSSNPGEMLPLPKQ